MRGPPRAARCTCTWTRRRSICSTRRPARPSSLHPRGVGTVRAMNAADEAVARGRKALDERAWTEARHAFTDALASGDRADAYAGLAEDASWLPANGGIQAHARAT